MTVGPTVRAGLGGALVVIVAIFARLGGHIRPLVGGSSAADLVRWLPWQLLDNVRHGRLPWDASGFAWGPSNLFAVAGNPGFAWFTAPLHLGGFAVGTTLGAALVALVNVGGGAAWGARHRVPWAGALVGAGSWWVSGALDAAPALVGWGVGAGAATAWNSGRRRLGFALACIGGLVAPVPTTAFLLAGGAFPASAAAALGLCWAPAGTWGAGGAPVGSILWPLAGASRGLPLLLVPALVAVWQARGWPRLGAVATMLAILGGLVPADVAGFRLAGAPATGALLAAGLAGVVALALPLVGRTTRRTRAVILGFLLVDALGPPLSGLGVAPLPVVTVPEAFTRLAPSPRAGDVEWQPEGGGLGWIPLHRQRLARAPGGDVRSFQAAAVAEGLRRSSTPFVLVLESAGPVQASGVASTLGPPAEQVGALTLWSWP